MSASELKEVVHRLEAAAATFSEQRKPREYLGVEDAAEFVGLSKMLLDDFRTRKPGGPPFHKVGRRIVYGVADLRVWMEAHRQEPKA